MMKGVQAQRRRRSLLERVPVAMMTRRKERDKQTDQHVKTVVDAAAGVAHVLNKT